MAFVAALTALVGFFGLIWIGEKWDKFWEKWNADHYTEVHSYDEDLERMVRYTVRNKK